VASVEVASAVEAAGLRADEAASAAPSSTASAGVNGGEAASVNAGEAARTASAGVNGGEAASANADESASAGEIAPGPGDVPVRPGETYQDYVLNTEEPEDGDTEVRPERVFVPGAKEAIRLRPGTSELYLMTQLRDEAHRFAITHHRKRRGKRALHSALDDVPGVGPALKKTLLQAFGSVAAIAAADDVALTAIKGVGPALVKRLREAIGGGA
jgi:hypothetical protein